MPQNVFASLPDTRGDNRRSTLPPVEAMTARQVQLELVEVSGTPWRFPDDRERRQEMWKRIDQAARAGRIITEVKKPEKVQTLVPVRAPDLHEWMHLVGSYHAIDWAALAMNIAAHLTGH